MSSSDEFQRSALAYQKLVENKIRYRIDFFTERPLTIAVGSEKTAEEIHLQGNTVNAFEIIFTLDEFKHLSSVHKLKDIDDLSAALYEKAVNVSGKGKKFDMDNIRESNYFFDDTDKLQNPETSNMTDEEFQKTIEKTKNKHFLSKILSRLDALENLYSTMEKSGIDKNSGQSCELKIYAWDRKASSSERPHNSDIAANFLIEMEDKSNPEQPFTDFFVVLAEDGTYKGMSIFHPEYSYARDNDDRKTIEITPLSIEILQEDKIISKISADDKIIVQCQEKARKHDENIQKEAEKNLNRPLIEKYLNKISYHRSELITSLAKREAELRKNTDNPKTSKKILKNQEYYQSFTETFLFNELSVNDMSEIKDRLSKALADADAGSAKWKCIRYEINIMDSRITVKNMLNELEQLMNGENFSVDAYADKLTAFSAYLKNANIGRNLVLKVSEQIEQQSMNCDDFTAELIAYEVENMKQIAEQKSDNRISFGQSDSFRTTLFHIIQFTAQDNTMALTLPFEAVLNGMADSLSRLQEMVAEKIKVTANHIREKVSAILHKRKEQYTDQQSEAAEKAENKGTERNSDDTYFVIMDNTGTQGYRDYFTIVPVSKLNFQVPLAYRTEQQTEEQEISAEKNTCS